MKTAWQKIRIGVIYIYFDFFPVEKIKFKVLNQIIQRKNVKNKEKVSKQEVDIKKLENLLECKYWMLN